MKVAARQSVFAPALALMACLLSAPPGIAQSVTLTVAKSDKYGAYIADARGRALYMFKADKQGQGKTEASSNCYDACAKVWPPAIAEGTPGAGPLVDKSLIATIRRRDDAQQVTYNGWPLYYYVKDAGRGQTTGQDVKSFGAEWYLLGPDGKIIHRGR